ncbi:ankyrin repeat domain-containing protein 2A-like isoform X3 [Papaver somniferum]|uniref:ankyrin repeat domain-containing protein 2A-like isoform X3 n=1 Tax=Papaver somniferum TaxID=3469 RepID=UPI000E6F9502|nr:ankyrin repeat domain-containing protein 2A-like isoform X3 [Papaver somniferum]
MADMTNKARYHSESKKAYRKKLKKNKREKAKLEKLRIVRSDEEKEEEAYEIITSGPTVEELEISKLEHDPSSNSTSTSIPEEDLEELMTSIKKDPFLKPILEDQVMTRGKARYRTESKKAYKKKLKKNKREKAKLQKLQTVRSEEEKEEEAYEITISGPIAEEVEISKLEHDPSSNSTCASISEEDLEELMTSIKKDPYLKPILEDIEIGGPTVMMRYLNDPEVFQKLAQAMGFGVLGDNVSSVEDDASNADAERL